MSVRAALVIGSVLASGCHTPLPPDPTPAELTSIPIGGLRDKVDLLFMVDNSPSMSPKQSELRARFPELLQTFQTLAGGGHPASYHIGVVTSDLGAAQYTLGGGQCHPGGDHGALQALGAMADASCKPPTGNLSFIDYDQIHGTDNLPAGQDLPTTFGCMASVGDRGCGFEMPLESVYRALHDPPAANAGFLRPDALLVVVFLTDEDDCSTPPDSDLFDPATVASSGALLSYRCTNWGIACGSPATLMPYGASGPLAGCHAATPAEGSRLTDVNRYIDFFSKSAAQGGVKIDPGDVILATISAPPTPVESLLANPSPTPPGPYADCAGPIDGMHCAVVLQHSCVSPGNSSFFGDPAVRLRQVVSSVHANQATSICDSSYGAAMQSLGTLMSAHVAPDGCLPRAPLDAAQPECQVADVGPQPDGTTRVSELAACATGARPCWRLDGSSTCAGGWRLVIDRGGGPVPASTVQRAACALAPQ